MHENRKILLAGIAVAGMITTSAQGESYYVNRSFSQNGNIATLIGTLDVPLGNYTIMNKGDSPFTSVNLTLTVNSFSYSMDNAVTGGIFGTGKFLISATPTSLTFGTADANGFNQANLYFIETPSGGATYYVIGSDSSPGFELAFNGATAVSRRLVFPHLFGLVVPEPSTFALLVLGSAFIVRRRHA